MINNQICKRSVNIPGGVFLRVFVLFIMIYAEGFAQVKSNMELFYTLIDSSAEKALSELPQNVKEISLTTTLGDSYSVFNNRIIGVFDQNSVKINGNTPHLNFVIDDAKVTYNEMFRNSLFGEYLVSREVTLKGNYHIDDNNVKQFAYSSIDTINIADIGIYESYSYPFTQGKVPPEPIFSGLFEPIIAISAAAAVVILFFTIRSH